MPWHPPQAERQWCGEGYSQTHHSILTDQLANFANYIDEVDDELTNNVLWLKKSLLGVLQLLLTPVPMPTDTEASNTMTRVRTNQVVVISSDGLYPWLNMLILGVNGHSSTSQGGATSWWWLTVANVISLCLANNPDVQEELDQYKSRMTEGTFDDE